MGTLTITGGTLRSRRIPTPPGRAVRPTPARVKEALFSILGARLDRARVLDLFAGSGALGFESLSRGAAHVTFVEMDRAGAERLRTCAAELGVVEQVDVIAVAAERAVQVLSGRFDLVFADPPYAQPFPARVLHALQARRSIDPDTTVIYERASRAVTPLDPVLRLERTERYGEVTLEFFRPQGRAA